MTIVEISEKSVPGYICEVGQGHSRPLPFTRWSDDRGFATIGPTVGQQWNTTCHPYPTSARRSGAIWVAADDHMYICDAIHVTQAGF